MSGHSKWKNTKRRKAIQDLKRGKIFSKLMHDAQIAIKFGGEDISCNARLRMILEKASSNNMAKNTFNRIISRCFDSENKKKRMQDIIYEGYGPGGTALLLKCLFDNKNRIVSEIRYTLSKFGGRLGINGSVAYLFHKKGVISCISYLSEDIIIDTALKFGADDIDVREDGIIKMYISLEILPATESELRSLKVVFDSEVFMLPDLCVNLDACDSLRLSSLIDMLKKIRGIYAVYHNGNFLRS